MIDIDRKGNEFWNYISKKFKLTVTFVIFLITVFIYIESRTNYPNIDFALRLALKERLRELGNGLLQNTYRWFAQYQQDGMIGK